MFLNRPDHLSVRPTSLDAFSLSKNTRAPKLRLGSRGKPPSGALYFLKVYGKGHGARGDYSYLWPRSTVDRLNISLAKRGYHRPYAGAS
jgi:hypothetical protein